MRAPGADEKFEKWVDENFEISQKNFTEIQYTNYLKTIHLLKKPSSSLVVPQLGDKSDGSGSLRLEPIFEKFVSQVGRILGLKTRQNGANLCQKVLGDGLSTRHGKGITFSGAPYC